MIGIYKIVNRTNGKTYVGQSVDIERRFAEHKTPKANGNDRLHNDIKTLGIDNFDFQVIELCTKDELNAKELHYIRSLNPFYNCIGKQRPKETREKISKTLKKRWINLDEEEKQKIIKNNLKGPRKGHEVSQATREKLREWVKENQGQKVMIVETGQTFKKIKDLENYLGVCSGTCASYWAGKIKSVKGFHVVKCRD